MPFMLSTVCDRESVSLNWMNVKRKEFGFHHRMKLEAGLFLQAFI